MPISQSLPPYLEPEDSVILYDGVCKLCNAWCNFIINHDVDNRFKLASVQSKEGQAILSHFGYPCDYYETMLVVAGFRCFEKSEAFFTVINKLRLPWRLVMVFRLIPLPIRDWLYTRIALNRYKLFGKYEYCLLPTPGHEARNLNG